MIIGEFQKNSAERIHVKFETYKKVRFLDLRAYYEADESTWKPTRKGLAIPLDKIGTLIEILKKAQKKVEKS